LSHPCIFVLFGGTGDLARKKLIPALFRLHAKEIAGGRFAIVAVGRRAMTLAEYAASVRPSLPDSAEEPFDEALWKLFCDRLFYFRLDFSEDVSAFQSLGRELSDLDRRFETCGNRIFCLAISPVLMKTVIQSLQDSGMIHNEDSWQRVMIEKPFGTDLESAAQLNRSLTSCLPEERIFRVDHYLGKEMIQNILSLRFGNILFESVWNREHIDHIQITSAETIGMESRGAYYENTGILRDMLQSHILQVLSLVCMDPPKALDTRSVIAEKVKVLRSLKLTENSEQRARVLLGQYGPGRIDSTDVPGYRKETMVSESSLTPTFAALKVYLDMPRWKGVPVYIRAGKRLDRKIFEIAVVFRHPKDLPRYPEFTHALPNALIIRIQPCGEILVRINVKEQDADQPVRSVVLDCSEKCICRQNSPESYERLIQEILLDHHALFTTWNELSHAWKFTEKVEAAAAKNSYCFPNYPAGSEGPKGSYDLIGQDGRHWMEETDENL
jgi:glucose-6-phosphate 1-dehydrogenase